MSSACENFRGQHPLWAEIWSPEKKSIWVGPNSRHTFWIMDQGSPDLFRRTREESFSITCLSDFGYPVSFQRYSRSKSDRKLCKIAPNFACFWPPKVFKGQSPEFLDLDNKAHPLPRYRSCVKVSWESAE